MARDEYVLRPTRLAAMVAVWFLGGFAGIWAGDYAARDQAEELLNQATTRLSVAEALVDSVEADRRRAFEAGIELGARTRDINVFLEDAARESTCYSGDDLGTVCCWKR